MIPQSTTQHAELGEVKYTVHGMSNQPDAQVAQTVAHMWRRVMQDAQCPEFIDWTRQIVAGCLDQQSMCRAIWRHVKGSIRFKNDEKTGAGMGVDTGIDPEDVVEVLIRPVDMMRYVREGVAVGDCDDFSMYEAAMLQVCGIECKFVTVAANGVDPNQYSHVYTVAYLRPSIDDLDELTLNPFRKERWPMDASHGEYCGWEVPNAYGKLKEWGVGEAGQWMANVLWIGLEAGLLWWLMRGFK